MVSSIRGKNKGFTLAEVLIVLAILLILCAIVFVNVIQHQRSLAQVERDGIAKEIFVAAQVHLTAAESQGYLGLSEAAAPNPFGQKDDDGTYYLIYPTKNTFDNTPILDLMLPFGSIDETVRLGGSYIIRYDKASAQVLDVFYCSTDHSVSSVMTGRFNTLLTQADYLAKTYGAGKNESFLKYFAVDADSRKHRQTYKNDYVLGWYGGVDVAQASTINMQNPRIIVHNEETLWVEIIYSEPTFPSGSSYTKNLTLWVRGQTSGVAKEIDLGAVDGTVKKYTLDDITTANKQFYSLFCNDTLDKSLISGEDIQIYAQLACYSGSTLVKTVLSNIETTNSLFGDGTTVGNQGTAVISNFRHLENLDRAVSYLSMQSVLKSDTVAYSYANQTTDLSWTDFTAKTGGASAKVYKINDSTGTKDNCCLPVSQDYALEYDGKGYAISNVKVDCTGDAGLFGNPTRTLKVSNLQLIDFDVVGTSSAGALAGTLNGATVTNVLARNSSEAVTKSISASTGDAGGLVGSMTGGSISKSAAALVVSGKTNAGGLIGKAEGGTNITACYSGGHTTNGKYSDTVYNVTATGGNAGGLAGTWSSTGTISQSYSTCSASGTTAGGLVGSATGGTITDSYATGLVSGPTKHAFIGSGTLSDSSTGNYYFKIINNALAPVSKTSDDAHIRALDASTTTYNDFVGSSWNSSSAYDSRLMQYYQGKYNLKTVAQLGASVDENTDFVIRHYGDWPAPEVFIPNAS